MIVLDAISTSSVLIPDELYMNNRGTDILGRVPQFGQKRTLRDFGL
jgi:hypothetical protein